MKFRKKPVVIDAVQWQPDPANEERGGYDKLGVEYTLCARGIQTPEGFMHVKPGDWIITGVKGEKYPCRADIFALTYEPAE